MALRAVGATGGGVGSGAIRTKSFTIATGTAVPTGSQGVQVGVDQVLEAAPGDVLLAMPHVVLNAQSSGYGYIYAAIRKGTEEVRKVGSWLRPDGQAYFTMGGGQGSTLTASDIDADGTVTVRWTWNIDSIGSPALWADAEFLTQVIAEVAGGAGASSAPPFRVLGSGQIRDNGGTQYSVPATNPLILKTVNFTVFEESFVRLEVPVIYLGSVSGSCDFRFQLSSDAGATWSTLDPYGTPPASFLAGNKARMDPTIGNWTTTPGPWAFLRLVPGEYQFRIEKVNTGTCNFAENPGSYLVSSNPVPSA